MKNIDMLKKRDNSLQLRIQIQYHSLIAGKENKTFFLLGILIKVSKLLEK